MHGPDVEGVSRKNVDDCLVRKHMLPEPIGHDVENEKVRLEGISIKMQRADVAP